MAKIAVVHVPFFSHINAATRLTAVLTEIGHDVVAFAPEECRPRIEAVGASLEPHHPEMPNVDGFHAWVSALAATTERESKDMVESLYAHDVDLIVHDSQVPWARVAGDYLGVPRIVSHPMFPIISPHAIRSEADLQLPTTHPEDARATFEESWLAIAGRWGVELGGWENVIHSASVSETTFTYTTQLMVGDYELPEGWQCVGPLMEPPPARVQRKERPLVYVCFGTSFNARPESFSAVIEGLADEPVDVLVSTGGGRVAAEHLSTMPSNVALRDFVPAREILARADVHLSHGGCNSVHETLLAGVPMVMIPQAYDQFPLTWRVEQLGAGRVVQEDPSEIRDTLRWVLEDERPTTRARELGRHLADYDGKGKVAEVVENVLAESTALRS